jgi:hypothetical protein
MLTVRRDCKEELEMYISLKESLEQDFKRWSDAHPKASNDNLGDLAVTDALLRPAEAVRGPWLILGVGNTL